jgi:uncharacterized protein (TIGR03083 family)
VAKRAAEYDGLVRALLAQWDRLLAALPAMDPTADSRVAGWTVREVEAHLTATTLSLARLLDEPEPAGPAVGIAAWADAVPGLAAAADEGARTTEPALAAAVATARAALAGQEPGRLVQQRTGTHTLLDAVRFRLIEGVVHGVDLGIDADPVAKRYAVKALVEVLVERAPGHAVEVRIPPYTAVQVVEGPRHTRGTPPNTVEIDPVAWLDLATGRTTWGEAVRTGTARVRGDRADLSPWLPLLT